MKHFAAATIWICLLVVLVSMSCRLLWLASHAETGLQTIGQHWREATIGLVLGRNTPLHSREPVEQAAFWLNEADRVTEMYPDNAELTIGAALVLDCPARSYRSNYLKKVVNFPGIGLFPDFDEAAIERAEDAFEARCKERCLELAARATHLDPSNVEWWRIRGLLLWRSSTAPRSPDWGEVLRECALHDPDNALYDYLAACFYWETSAEMEFSETNDRLMITDEERFQRGVSCFEQGQTKPIFMVGDEGFTAVAKFLSQTTLPLNEHEQIVNSREIHLRRSVLLRNVWHWQGMRAYDSAAASDFDAALAMRRQNLRLVDQFANASRSNAYDNVAMACRVTTTMRMNSLVNDHRDALSSTKWQRINALEERARLDEKVVAQAAKGIAAEKTQLGTGIGGVSPAQVIPNVAVAVAPSMAVVWLFIGFVSITLSRLGARRDLPTVGVLGHTLAILVAFTLSIVVFGLAPSKIINRETQAWVLTLLIITTPTVIAALVAWSLLRRRALKFSLLAMLISMFVLCVLLGLVAITRPEFHSFAQIPFDLSIPSRGWGGLDARSLENVILPRGDWLWAICQWAAYFGHYLTVVLWAGFIAALFHVKVGRSKCHPDCIAIPYRERISALSRSLGRPAIAVAAAAMAIYLAFAPNVVNRVEKEFQNEMAFARMPTKHWTIVHNAVEKVRSDEAMMNQLTESVRAEMSEAKKAARRTEE